MRFTKLFDSKNYFEVIILSVQLFESIALDIQYSKEYMEMENLVEGFTDDKYRRWVAIYNECQSILDKYRGRESARVKFIEMLYQDYNVDEKSWVTTLLIQEVNRIFSL